MIDWILRFFKGAIIGTGFILPGISGGALAAIFGVYQRIVSFIAHITRDFIKNVLFFIPLGLGGLFGMFMLARPLSYFLEYHEAQVIWGFVGCIVGTMPKLWKEAGKEGRTRKHYIILILTALIGFCLLYAAKIFMSTQMPLNFITWIFAGFLISLGVLVPGISAANFLVYLGMYKPMVNAFSTLNFPALVPIFLGTAIFLFSLSKLVDLLLRKIYAGFFHFVVGIVIASTIMIIPVNINYLSSAAIICAITFIAGAVLGLWMGKMEEKYKK